MMMTLPGIWVVSVYEYVGFIISVEGRHGVALRCICFDKHVHGTTQKNDFQYDVMSSSCRFWGPWLTRVLIILEYERKDFVTMSVGPLHDNCRSICSAVTWLMRNPRCCRKNMCMYMVEVLVWTAWLHSASVVSKGSKLDVSLHTYRFKVIFVLFRYIHSHSCI